MRAISRVKAITMVEEAALSNKTRIVALAAATESAVVDFDDYNISPQRRGDAENVL